MGAKSWMIAYSDGCPRDVLVTRPKLDEVATDSLVATLFGKTEGRIGAADLCSINPPDNEIVAGVYAGLGIVAAADFGIDYPSRLDLRFIDLAPAPSIHLHAMHSVVDWFAFGIWQDQRLTRSLSLSPDHGIMEDIGDRLEFEKPYWDGSHPAVDDGEDYDLPFHPLDLAEVVLAERFGFVLEGLPLTDSIEPEELSLIRYKRKPRWKFW